MRYVSLFSGIEAASVAWGPLGWEPVAFSEIEPFCCAVLAERFPDVPNLGDVAKTDWSGYEGSVDVVVGGSPCQAFSIAGRREGLLDSRGRLMLEYVRAVREVRPRWVLWENVPGVLSQDKGEAFATLQDELEQCGYSLAWRTLDAQFFGVAQRRRRVFLVGHPDLGRAAAVLFERESLRWDSPSSRARRESLAARAGRDPAGADVIAFNAGNKNDMAHVGRGQVGVSPTLRASASGTNQVPVIAFSCNASGSRGFAEAAGLSPTLRASHPSNVPAVLALGAGNAESTDGSRVSQASTIAFKYHQGAGARGIGACEDGTSPTLTADYHQPAVLAFAQNSRDEVRLVGGEPVLRRLMPVECERLQGFPDGWTRVPYRGKPAEECPDTPRYKALGNSMAVPVMRWIGERIAMVEEAAR